MSKENKSAPFWHFVVRGWGHVGMFMVVMAAYLLINIPEIMPLLFILHIIAQNKLIALFDYVLLDMEEMDE